MFKKLILSFRKNFDDIKCPCCRKKIQIWKPTRKVINKYQTLKTWRTKLNKCIEAENSEIHTIYYRII